MINELGFISDRSGRHAGGRGFKSHLPAIFPRRFVASDLLVEHPSKGCAPIVLLHKQL
jgi:hypothetical protein